MNDILVSSSVIEDTASIAFEGIWYGNTTGDWATLIDLLHHGLFTSHRVKLVDSVDRIMVGYETRLVGMTVFANVNGRALDSIGVSASLVDRA